MFIVISFKIVIEILTHCCDLFKPKPGCPTVETQFFFALAKRAKRGVPCSTCQSWITLIRSAPLEAVFRLSMSGSRSKVRGPHPPNRARACRLRTHTPPAFGQAPAAPAPAAAPPPPSPLSSFRLYPSAHRSTLPPFRSLLQSLEAAPLQPVETSLELPPLGLRPVTAVFSSGTRGPVRAPVEDTSEEHVEAAAPAAAPAVEVTLDELADELIDELEAEETAAAAREEEGVLALAPAMPPRQSDEDPDQLGTLPPDTLGTWLML